MGRPTGPGYLYKVWGSGHHRHPPPCRRRPCRIGASEFMCKGISQSKLVLCRNWRRILLATPLVAVLSRATSYDPPLVPALYRYTVLWSPHRVSLSTVPCCVLACYVWLRKKNTAHDIYLCSSLFRRRLEVPHRTRWFKWTKCLTVS